MANCCATVTHTVQGVCCPPGTCPKNLHVAISLASTSPTNAVMRDVDTGATLAPGLVWESHSVDANCAWTSCDLIANSSIDFPFATGTTPTSYYVARQVVNNMHLDPIVFTIDVNLVPTICGTTQDLLDLAI